MEDSAVGTLFVAWNSSEYLCDRPAVELVPETGTEEGVEVETVCESVFNWVCGVKDWVFRAGSLVFNPWACLETEKQPFGSGICPLGGECRPRGLAAGGFSESGACKVHLEGDFAGSLRDSSTGFSAGGMASSGIVHLRGSFAGRFSKLGACKVHLRGCCFGPNDNSDLSKGTRASLNAFTLVLSLTKGSLKALILVAGTAGSM